MKTKTALSLTTSEAPHSASLRPVWAENLDTNAMPIPLYKALKWASEPETLRLVHDLASAPEDDRRAEETALLRSARHLLGPPARWVRPGLDRNRALVWLVDVHTEFLRRVAEARTRGAADTVADSGQLPAPDLFAICDRCIDVGTCKTIGCIAKELEETV